MCLQCPAYLARLFGAASGLGVGSSKKWRERGLQGFLLYFSLSRILGWLIHSPQTDKVCFHFFLGQCPLSYYLTRCDLRQIPPRGRCHLTALFLASESQHSPAQSIQHGKANISQPDGSTSSIMPCIQYYELRTKRPTRSAISEILGSFSSSRTVETKNPAAESEDFSRDYRFALMHVFNSILLS
jgi:hypothetical protein